MPQPKNAGSAEAREAQRREDQLLAGIASLRDMLSKGVVITSDRLQEVVDETVRRGRMTRQDAEELVQNLVAVGRRQSQDALAEIEDLVGRSAKETRRQAHARVRSVGAAARRAPGTDRALRTVDRVRRAAGLGHAFPIIGYEDLTAAQVRERLGDLNPAELRKVRDHERRNANRKSVLTAIERKLK
jgi:polyhydroxyalkanoate synthesis regulator phasin